MNLLRMKYAVAVAKAGSLGKASQALMVAAPNISRAIRELEADLGIAIFERTQKGMQLTPQGEEYIGFAKEILGQIDELERYYKEGTPRKQKFSVSVPRACYISEAFANFSRSLTKDAAEIFYKETNSQRTIDNLLNREYTLGIIRYAENYEMYFQALLEEKGLASQQVTQFAYSLIMSEDNPLARKEKILYEDLTDYIEIAHADPYVPSMSFAKVVKEELPDHMDRRIFIFERASQFDLLSLNPQTFMWVSLAPESLLRRYGLVIRKCEDNRKIYKDVLIYKKGYKLSSLDRLFVHQLYEAKRKYQ